LSKSAARRNRRKTADARAAAKVVPAAIAKTEHIVDYAVDYQEEDFGFGTWGGIDEY
jgi:hypothetical protein